MQHIKQLHLSLNHYLRLSFWNLECLCHFIVSLNANNDVNLSVIAKSFARKASYQSCYRRLQRFITRLPISFPCLWQLSQGLFLLPDKLTLTMDRTNWKFGKVHINFLFVGIVYKGVAIPVIWCLLPERKRGNSNTIDRVLLFDKLQRFLPFTRIARLLCDREFIDHKWISYLLQKEISFVIRAKDNLLADNKNLKRYFYNLKPNEQKIPRRSLKLLGLELYVSAKRLSDGDLLIIVTDKYDYHAINTYALRWEIESFFSAIKIRGYNFENTHITDQEKISKLMFVVSIALLWAYKCGEIKELKNQTTIKNHGYKATSLIKNGVILISKSIARLVITKKELIQIIKAVFDPNITLKKRMSLIGVV